MSIDKTLRHTNESASEIASLLDNKMRVARQQYSECVLGMPKLNSSHSLKDLRMESPRFSEIEYENELLRAEVAQLKKQLRLEKQHARAGVHDLEAEVLKLKKLIEKSYYSLKKLEEENVLLKKQHSDIQQKNSQLMGNMGQLDQRNKALEEKNSELYQYIQEIKKNHEKQVSIIWERVACLQKNLEAVVNLIQQDRWMDKKYETSKPGYSQGRGSKQLFYH